MRIENSPSRYSSCVLSKSIMTVLSRLHKLILICINSVKKWMNLSDQSLYFVKHVVWGLPNIIRHIKETSVWYINQKVCYGYNMELSWLWIYIYMYSSIIISIFRMDVKGLSTWKIPLFNFSSNKNRRLMEYSNNVNIPIFCRILQKVISLLLET